MLNEKDFTKEASAKRSEYVRHLPNSASIHLIGICGTGMAAVAGLLKELGFKVTGSDKAFYPPMGEVVKNLADQLFTGYSAENLKEKPDLVVIGNSVSSNNPEVKETLKLNLPFASMPEIFSALLIGSKEQCAKSIVVAGTHGKTTTTAAIAMMLDFNQYSPGYFIGGSPLNLPSGIKSIDYSKPINERIVVLEGDEYDSAFFAKWSKFYSYRPDIAIITSLEFDHADIYNSVEEIEDEFTEFVKLFPSDGQLILCDQAPRLIALAKQWQKDPEIKAKISFYGLNNSSTYRLLKRELTNSSQQLTLALEKNTITSNVILSGEHNALNFTATAAVGELLGLSPTQISNALAHFQGVKRRQQEIAEINGILVLEDFAHHPTAVDITLKGLKEKYPTRRLIAIFEPRSNTSRRGFFQKEYGQCFSAADLVILQNIKDATGYSKTIDTIIPLDVKQVALDISQHHPQTSTQVFDTVDQICEFTIKEAKPGDLVVVMSNGDFGGLLKMILEKIT